MGCRNNYNTHHFFSLTISSLSIKITKAHTFEFVHGSVSCFTNQVEMAERSYYNIKKKKSKTKTQIIYILETTNTKFIYMRLIKSWSTLRTSAKK